MNKHKLSWILVVALLLVGVMVVAAATPMYGDSEASTPVSYQGITPYIIADLYTASPNPGGGNRTCEDVGLAYFNDANYYQYTSGKVDYENDAFEFEPDEGWPSGLIVTVTGETYVEFSSTFGIGAAIVKGSNEANVYVYEPQLKSDSGLASPEAGQSGAAAGLSNLTFCWNPEGDVCEWIGETAWAAGDRYVTRGNWATYTPYVPDSTVILYAGQTMEAGTVYFSTAEDGIVTITITLNDGWQFFNDPGMENVKIQDYENAPSGNPAPGGFDHKGYAIGWPHSIGVPENNFYGVHVDVEWEKCE